MLANYVWRSLEILTKACSTNLLKDNLNKFYEVVRALYEGTGLLDATNASERIYNLDETGCNTNPCRKKLFFAKSACDVYMLAPNCRKTMYTVLFTGNAAGEYLPPMIVYKGKNMYESWTLGGPDGCKFANTYSSWMEDHVFENWFHGSFVPAVAEKEKPVVVFLDGHGSHLTYKTVVTAVAEKIEIVCLPPHTSHALQPMDITVFGPWKNNWRSLLQKYY